MLWSHVALCLPLLMVACGESAVADRQHLASSDSYAGATDLELVLDPVLELGGHEVRHGYALGQLRGAVLFDDRVIVADGTRGLVYAISLEGELIGRSGGTGRGHGE